MSIGRLVLLGTILALLLSTAALMPSCRAHAAANLPRVIVIGFDGFDPRMCERMMDAGELPNLDTMRQKGGYSPLGTSTPPQSPVAWASFITGADPGVHGIFDFIHRDPTTMTPYYSAARTVESSEGWEVGEHRIPLTFWPFEHNPTQTLLRREGVPFWDYLDAANIPHWLYDIPANYPPSESKYGNQRCLAGMGVPDLLGTYGTYQHFSKNRRRERHEGGGIRKPLRFDANHKAVAKLTGPQNSLLKQPETVEVEFTVHRHPTENTARIELQDQTVLLREGEWSDWQRVRFPMRMPPFLPEQQANGICRFYLQEVRPDFRLYVTPINIDPSDPAGQVVTEPPGFIEEISDQLGLFYTTGFQEDHKALSNGVFDDEEYRQQVEHVFDERMNLLHYALDEYENGLLFFYYSSTDLQAHMFWWDSDQPHPTRNAEDAKRYHAVIENLYRRMDKVVGNVVRKYGDDATILVMSDHGFCNFRRQFNLNTWLRDEGYLGPANARSLLDPRDAPLVDWNQTQAYGLGLNGLYLNLRGREKFGIVDPSEKDALLEELRQKLLAVRDPATHEPVIAEVYRSTEVYHGPQTEHAPDLLIGYHRGYRASWATTLGSITDELVTDNDSAWSADHCIATDQVPGVVFANRPIERENPSLVDLAPTILDAFDIEPPTSMLGGNLFTARPVAAAREFDKE